MRFLSYGFFHKSKVPRPKINTLKYNFFFFRGYIGEGESRFTFRIENAESKIRILCWPQFCFVNHNSIQVQMIHAIFISINLVFTALKFFKIGKFTLFYFSIYLPHTETWILIILKICPRGILISSAIAFSRSRLMPSKSGLFFIHFLEF